MDRRAPESKGFIAKALRAATIGAASLLLQGTSRADMPAHVVVERARQRLGEETESAVTQLVLHPGGTDFVIAGHRSHSSHASHASHRSHYSGTGSYDPPPYNPAPVVQPSVAPVPKTLRVVTVPRARVSIDGKDVGLSPTEPVVVKGPTVTVTLTHRFRGTIQKVVNVVDGANTVTIDW